MAFDLQALRPTERFSNRADDYRRYRPGYPKEVGDLIREVCGGGGATADAGEASKLEVADIGAGTGLFTKVLLEAGFQVSAVEPNDAMRAAAAEELSGIENLKLVAAPAENTGLAAGAFDAITVAQAFHWFDHSAARIEFQRLLKVGGPGGFVFIVRNRRLGGGSIFAGEFEGMLTKLGELYRKVGRPSHAAQGEAIRNFFAPGALQVARFDNPQTLDWEGLRGRFLSMSYAPKPGEPNHSEMIAELELLFQNRAVDGRVKFEQETEVSYGRLE
jgi:SAM-dependent methyltransferase